MNYNNTFQMVNSLIKSTWLQFLMDRYTASKRRIAAKPPPAFVNCESVHQVC